MANDFFAFGRESFATAQVNWPTDNIGVGLVDTDGVTISLATTQFVEDLLTPPLGAADAIVARGTLANNANKIAAGGVLDADDLTFPTVTGDEAEVLVIFKDTGVDATSPLLIFIDDAEVLPVIPNGGDIDVEWSTEGIATL